MARCAGVSTNAETRTSLNLIEIPDDGFKHAARIIREGFDRHYELFRSYCAEARQCFERGEWQQANQINRERIESYDLRVAETVGALEESFGSEARNSEAWPRIKRAFIGQLLDHLQAECAETFYNSVACRVLRREYYNNDTIVWRPVMSTEHLDGSQPSYRAYYPGKRSLRSCLLSILTRPGLGNRFENLREDAGWRRPFEKATDASGSESQTSRFTSSAHYSSGTRRPTSWVAPSLAMSSPRS